MSAGIAAVATRNGGDVPGRCRVAAMATSLPVVLLGFVTTVADETHHLSEQTNPKKAKSAAPLSRATLLKLASDSPQIPPEFLCWVRWVHISA